MLQRRMHVRLLDGIVTGLNLADSLVDLVELKPKSAGDNVNALSLILLN
jgi:hypothetical protein